MNENYKKLLNSFVEWGNSAEDIKAILVCGSCGYNNENAYDEWSDLDLAIYCSDPTKYKTNHQWLDQIHKTILTFETDFFGNTDLPVIRVQFTDHLEADIGILPYTFLNNNDATPDVLKVFSLGTKIVLDKDGLLSNTRERYLKYPQPYKKKYTKPQLDILITELSIDIVHTSKKIARKDLYFAYLDMTNYLAERIINLIFVYHKLHYGEINTMHDNLKNIKLWADKFTLSQVSDLFPCCNIPSLWKSMDKYIDLVVNVSRKIYSKSKFEFSTIPLDYAKNEIRYLQERSQQNS